MSKCRCPYHNLARAIVLGNPRKGLPIGEAVKKEAAK